MDDKLHITRKLKNTLQVSSKSILLLGPRQTGKSTLIRHLKPDLSINLANQREYLNHSSDQGYLESILNEVRPKTVFIDEIQRIPSMLNTLQDIIDNWTDSPKFYLSGSCARKLKRGQANLLPGRLFSYELSGFCASELSYKIDVQKAMKYGFLPENYLSKNTSEIEKNLEMYSANYLTEEIKAEALTRNIQGFARFIFECAARSTQVIDYSKTAQQAKVSRTSSIRFFEILEDTMIAQRIDCYAIEGVETIKHPKLYFFDVGVLNGLLNNYSSSNDRKGMLFEQLVYNQLSNSLRANDFKIKIEYFRTRHGTEVDFIVHMKNKKIAIEVKSGIVHQDDIEPLLRLKKYDPTITEFYIVGLHENKSRRIKDIIICGINELIKKIGL